MPEYNYPGYGPTGQNWLTSRPGTKGGYHGGNDNPAPAHTPVYAEHSGTVFRSGEIDGYGLAVVVESVAPDRTKFYELYGHLAPGTLPAPNSKVTAGQLIPGALIGTKEDVTSRGGLSTGPHLHREIISGNAPLKKEGAFGIYSSDITHKANPDTFDINNPVFPYEHNEIKPAPELARPSLHSPTGPSLPQTMLPGDNPAARAPLSPNIVPPAPNIPQAPRQLSPGMAIPGARDSTSIGGPDGPTPLLPPASTPPMQFAPSSPPRTFGPFTIPGNPGDSGNDWLQPQRLSLPIPPDWTTPPPRPQWPSPAAPNLPRATAMANRPGPAYFSGPNGMDANRSPPSSGGDDVRKLSRETYSQSSASDSNAPTIPFGQSADASSAGNALGILSGQPMPQWTTPLPLADLFGLSKASGGSDLSNLLASLVSPNPTQREPPPQTGDSGAPVRRLSRVNQPPTPAFDPAAPAAPLAPSADPDFSGGVLGRYAAMGIDPQMLMQSAPPPDDDDEQANLRALEARLSSSGNIMDALALYNARRSSWG